MREPQKALLRSLVGFLSRNISRKEDPHRDISAALRFGRDDKGKRGASRESTLLNGSLDLDRSFPPLTCRRQVVSPRWHRVKFGTNQLLSPRNSIPGDECRVPHICPILADVGYRRSSPQAGRGRKKRAA